MSEKLQRVMAEIRRTGKTNMYDKQAVTMLMYGMGYIDEASEILANNNKFYLDNLIKSGDY